MRFLNIIKGSLSATCLALSMTSFASANDFYVDSSAPLHGTGTIAKPFCRITDAVDLARAEWRAGDRDPITIHVAPGTYTGSYFTTGPKIERLPIVLDTPKLKLKGATRLVYDARGIPTAISSTSQPTMLTTNDALPEWVQHILAIARTTDGESGEGITLSGIWFNFPNNTSDNAPICMWADHVKDFDVEGNVMSSAFGGFNCRLSSGKFIGNIASQCYAPGMLVSAGTEHFSAKVEVSKNRIVGNVEGLVVQADYDDIDLDFGANTVSPIPLHTSGPNVEMSTGIVAAIIGNDISKQSGNGIRFMFSGLPFDPNYVPDGTRLPEVNVAFLYNSVIGNAYYGVVIDGGDANPGGPSFSGRFSGEFRHNSVDGSGVQSALFTFGGPSGNGPVLYLQNAIYSLCDPEGELAGFDYDNPVLDPYYGTLLKNTFILNGQVVPHGTKFSSGGGW